MPLDYLVGLLAGPLGLVLVAAIILFGTALLHGVWEQDVESFGPTRIFLGYAAGLVGILAYSAWEAVDMAVRRIDEGTLPDGMFYEVLPGWTIYTFVLNAITAVFVLAVFGVPLIVLSHRLKIASVATSCAMAIGLAVALHGCWFLMASKNQWQQTHLDDYYVSTLTWTVIAFVIAGIAFSLGARQPLIFRRRVDEEARPGQQAGRPGE